MFLFSLVICISFLTGEKIVKNRTEDVFKENIIKVKKNLKKFK